jgi:hypothetical protein
LFVLPALCFGYVKHRPRNFTASRNRYLTSLRNFRERQAGAPLQVDIVREYQGAQSSEWLAREEVGFSTLLNISAAYGR